MSWNTSVTFMLAFADVSQNVRLLSSAYVWASSLVTARASAKSALLPAKAMIMLGLPYIEQDAVSRLAECAGLAPFAMHVESYDKS